MPAEVIFVCHGNIYRSPYAAYYFEARIPELMCERIRVSSAGFVGSGRPSPDNALRLAAERGYDMSTHRSSLLSHERVRGGILVVVMDAGQQRAICERYGKRPQGVIVLGDLDPESIATRTIRDPWEQPDEVLMSSYNRIERCVDALADALFVH